MRLSFACPNAGELQVTRPAGHYRIYTIGSAAHFLGVQVIECADDKEAIKTARQLVDDRDVEVWKRDRFITLLPGKPLP